MFVRVLQGAINLYIGLIVIWALGGSFFPDWRYSGWYKALGDIVEPYLSLFRGLRLQVGMFDLSPMIAVAFLSILQLIAGAVALNAR